jgi:hypothetical protein
MMVVKLSPGGLEQWNWTTSPTSQADEVMGIAVSPGGINYPAGIDSSAGSFQWRVQKLTAGGLESWSWTDDPGGTDIAYGIARDFTGDLYVGGTNHTGPDYKWRLARLISTGVTDWVWDDNPSPGYDALFAVPVDPTGAVVGAGSDNKLGGSNDEWRVVKLAFPPAAPEFGPAAFWPVLLGALAPVAVGAVRRRANRK